METASKYVNSPLLPFDHPDIEIAAQPVDGHVPPIEEIRGLPVGGPDLNVELAEFVKKRVCLAGNLGHLGTDVGRNPVDPVADAVELVGQTGGVGQDDRPGRLVDRVRGQGLERVDQVVQAG